MKNKYVNKNKSQYCKKKNHMRKTPITYKHSKNNNTKISKLRNKVITVIITQQKENMEKKGTTTSHPKKIIRNTKNK